MIIRSPSRHGGAAGGIITFLLIVGLIALGAWLILDKKSEPTPPSGTPMALPPTAGEAAVAKPEGDAPQPIEPSKTAPRLEAPAPYVMKNNVVEVDISEYAGYAGLVVANGGLAANPDSIFAKQFGFQVQLLLSEGENWGKMNNGKFAASATTVDVLAVLGRQFDALVPVQIGFSRGADMIVVDRGIGSVNQLKGKVLAASQFNESEFFLRYLAQEAGITVQTLRDLDAKPAPDQIGLVFYEDATIACDAYQHELASGAPRLAGCVGWSPRTDEVVAAANGQAKILASNRNLLVIADVLCVNKGFATANPTIVQGLVQGLLQGNRQVRDQPEAHLAVIAKAMQWSVDDTREELKKVHLANLPENLAFFAGTIDAAGSYGGIYQSAVLTYGTQILPNPADPDRFLDQTALKALHSAGTFADQQIAIAPIRTSTRQVIEGEALLAKDIRFLYEPNSAILAANNPENAQYLDTIKRYLQVSPGSVVVLNGHVDNAQVASFRKEGGDSLVRTMGLKAMELSKQRAASVKSALLERYPKLDPQRIETIGRGWEQPAGTDSNLNRRVAVQWFTLE